MGTVTRARRGCAAVAMAALGAVAFGACSGGASHSDEGARVLRESRAVASRATALRYGLTTRIGGSRGLQQVAVRGTDLQKRDTTADGSVLDLRDVGGRRYVQTDATDTTAPGPWVTFPTEGPDATLLPTLYGVAPESVDLAAIAGSLFAGVEDVTGMSTDGARRTLSVTPKPVADGERPERLVVGTGDRLRSRLAALYGGGKAAGTRTYSGIRWDDEVTAIAAPATALDAGRVRDPQLDPLRGALLRPSALPAGWAPRFDYALTALQSTDACGAALVGSTPTGAATVATAFLATWQYPTTCRIAKPLDAASFTAGTWSGWVKDADTGRVGALTVDGKPVRFASTLSVAELQTVLATWVPLAGS